MRRITVALCFTAIGTTLCLPAMAENGSLVSVAESGDVKRSGNKPVSLFGRPAPKPDSTPSTPSAAGAVPGTMPTAQPAMPAAMPAAMPVNPAAAAAAGIPAPPVMSPPTYPGGMMPPGYGMMPVALPPPSQVLQQAFGAYKANPNPAAFTEFLRIFKILLNDPATHKLSAAAIIKANPVLAEAGAKPLDAGAGRVWTFPRMPFNRELIVQWADTKAQVSFVGRRHRIKKVTYATTWRMQSVYVPANVKVKEARVAAGPEGARALSLVGEENGSSLWLHAFKNVDGSWKDSPTQFDSIPAFLTQNVSGKVQFRGTDLIFLVGRVVAATTSESGIKTGALPEADSSTYKFWLRLSENGYVLEHRLPDEEQYRVVLAFLHAVQQSHTDAAKTMLLDSKLVSIPRYVGVKNSSTAFKVVQMASPGGGSFRYRLVTFMKDDLIFDVAKIKDRMLIKSIFIAPADPFLQEIAKNLPQFDKISEPPPPKPADEQAAPKH